MKNIQWTKASCKYSGVKAISRRHFLQLSGATAIGMLTGSQAVMFNTRSATAQTKRKNLIIGQYGEPANLNGFLRQGNHGGQVSNNIYNKLVRVNYETREMDPELAVSWTEQDPKTWIIKLREGVQWHKGYGEFTAKDVEYTFNYILDKKTFQVRTALFPVERAKALDKYTVEVKLNVPFGAFPAVTLEYGGTIMCAAAHEEMGPEEYGRRPIGTGPFEFDSWTSGSHLLLKKNQQYWKKGLPYLEEITWRFIPDPSVRLASLVKGEIDFMDHPDPKDIPDLRAGQKYPHIMYTSRPGWNWDYMAFTFPPYIGEEFPTVRKEVRQAISYAIDREVLTNEIYFGEALVSDSPIPPGFLGYREVPIRYPKNADIEKARELMQKAGVSSFDLEVITSDKDWLRREVELVGAMLSEIGINVKIQGLDVGTWTDRWFGHKFQALLEDITIVSPDPDSTVFWFHHPDTCCYHGWPRPDIAKILDEARVSSDSAQREKLYHQVVDAVLEDSPYIYLSHINYIRLFRKGLEGYQPSPQEHIIFMDTVRWT